MRDRSVTRGPVASGAREATVHGVAGRFCPSGTTLKPPQAGLADLKRSDQPRCESPSKAMPSKSSLTDTFAPRSRRCIVVLRVAGPGELSSEPVRVDEGFLGRTPWHVQACRSEMDVLVVNDDRHCEGRE